MKAMKNSSLPKKWFNRGNNQEENVIKYFGITHLFKIHQ